MMTSRSRHFLNWLFDQLPGPELRFGLRAIPTFLVTVVIGVMSASFWFIALAALRGADVLVALGIVPLTTLVAVLVALVRQRITKREEWVLLEHLCVVLLSIGGLLTWLHEPIPEWLDRAFCALSVMCCFGRIGCANAGCCYGPACAVGTHGGPSGERSVRRFPIQLAEASCWGILAALGSLLVFTARPGIAFATCALLYSGFRFVAESIRCDRRPTLLGLSESRWLSVALAAAAVWVLVLQKQVTETSIGVGAGGLMAFVMLLATRRWWLVLPQEANAELLASATASGRRLGNVAADGELHREWLQGHLLVGSKHLDGAHEVLTLSVSRKGASLLRHAEASFVLEAAAKGAGHEAARAEVVEGRPGQFVMQLVGLAPPEPTFAQVRSSAPLGSTVQFQPSSTAPEQPRSQLVEPLVDNRVSESAPMNFDRYFARPQ